MLISTIGVWLMFGIWNMNYAWAIGMRCCPDKNLIAIHCIADERIKWVALTSCLNSEMCLMKCPVNDKIMNYPTKTMITVTLKNNRQKEADIT